MKEILESTFKNHTKGFQYTIIGKKMVIIIDKLQRIEVELYNRHMKMALYSKMNDIINETTVKFEDVFECATKVTNVGTISKQIRKKIDGKYEWFVEPTEKDIQRLQETLVNYIDAWI